MSVGCLIYISPKGQVFHRIPCWPWPAPGRFPETLPDGAGYVQFFPHNYLRFTIGDFVSPFPPVPYVTTRSTMKTLARNIPLTLSSRSYVCDILLGIYTSSQRPAILLVESRPSSLPGERAWAGEPVATASTNAPEEYIQHLTPPHFTAKDYSENEGLWAQLLPLRDEDGFPLFVQTRYAITLGFVKAPIMLLGPNAALEFSDLRDEITHPTKGSSHEQA
jgi:hypothetical protein